MTEEFCWATYRVASKQDTSAFRKKHDPSKRATQIRVTFRPGHEPGAAAGLSLRGKEVPAGG